MVRKSFFVYLILCLMSSLAFAEVAYRMRSNPQTGRGDWVVDISKLTAADLPIPDVDLSSYVPESRTLTINGTTQDLSANRTFTIPDPDGTIYGFKRVAPYTILTNSGDNVGIGTSTPQYKLDVEGTTYTSGKATIASGIANGLTIGNMNIYQEVIGGVAYNMKFDGSSGNEFEFLQPIRMGASFHLGENYFYIGIPSGNAGRLGFNDSYAVNETALVIENQDIIAGPTRVGSVLLKPTKNAYVELSDDAGTYLFAIKNNSLSVVSNMKSDGSIYASGNIGIGTSEPSQKLETNGVIYSSDGGFQFPDMTIQTTAATNTPPGGANTNVQFNNSGSFGGNGGFVYVNTNVGIGTSVPQAKLDVDGTTYLNNDVTFNSDTAGSNFIWDASESQVTQTIQPGKAYAFKITGTDNVRQIPAKYFSVDVEENWQGATALTTSNAFYLRVLDNRELISGGGYDLDYGRVADFIAERGPIYYLLPGQTDYWYGAYIEMNHSGGVASSSGSNHEGLHIRISDSPAMIANTSSLNFKSINIEGNLASQVYWSYELQLTSRTDGDTGTFTFLGVDYNAIINGSTNITLYWDNGAGITGERTGMAVTGIAGLTVTLDGGTGDDLPAEGTTGFYIQTNPVVNNNLFGVYYNASSAPLNGGTGLNYGFYSTTGGFALANNYNATNASWAKFAVGSSLSGEWYATSSNIFFRNVTNNKDITISLNKNNTQTTFMFFDGSAGNIGIGTTVPMAKLEVEGSVYIGNGGTTGAGNVGIGSSVPTQTLDVNGTIYSHSNVGIGTSVARALLDVDGNIYQPKPDCAQICLTSGKYGCRDTGSCVAFY